MRRSLSLSKDGRGIDLGPLQRQLTAIAPRWFQGVVATPDDFPEVRGVGFAAVAGGGLAVGG
jgi:hypothetical protein